MAYEHAWRDKEDKVRELRDLTLNEIAEKILDLEVDLEECGGKLRDTEERLEEAETSIELLQVAA